MTTITAKTKDQVLTAVESPTVASGDKNTVDFSVELDSLWSGLTASAVFFTARNPQAVYEKILEKGKTQIPSEVLKNKGYMYIGIRAVDGEGSVKTSTVLKYRIEDGAPVGTATAEGPTPDVYQQLLLALNNLKTGVDNNATEIEDIIKALEKKLELNEYNSLAIGDGTASGTMACATGHNTTASGSNSRASGSGSTASGSNSSADGNKTSATGSNAHTEGHNTKAQKDSAHAEGSATTAAGSYSHSEGNTTTASGESAHSQGANTVASNYAAHAGGKYNADMTTGGKSNNKTGTAFVIGNGTGASAKSNALSIMYDGTVKAASTITASTAADYAELFEWEDENPEAEDRVGKFVTLNGDKIRLANISTDYILGVVSGRPFVLGNGDCDVWTKMYLTDEFNRYIKIPAPKMEEQLIEETGEVESVPVLDENGKQVYEGFDYKLNPEYDPDKAYISRVERPEWSAVGMLGVLPVYDDGTCKVNGYCTANKDAIATACDRNDRNSYRVIERVKDNIVKIIFK